MKIIIEISEKIYDTIMADEMPTREEMSVIITRIYQGTPLPKGHGRLIDADSFNEELDNGDYDTYNDYSNTFDWIEQAPTIIEADMPPKEGDTNEID